MRDKINFITLGVDDLNHSISFYRTLFGFAISEQDEDLCLFELQNGFYLAITTRVALSSQVDDINGGVNSGGVVLSQYANSKEEVNNIIQMAVSLGAMQLTTLDEVWGYSVTFKDINGHHWEILFSPNTKE